MTSDLLALITALQDRSTEVRQQAAEALCQRGTDAQPGCIALIDAAAFDSDDDVRQWSTAALEQIGPPLAHDIPQLTRRLASPNTDAAYWSATLLGRLGPQAAGIVEHLAEALASRRPLAVRQQAAWALGQIGPAAADALPALREALKAGDPRLARLAQKALESL